MGWNVVVDWVIYCEKYKHMIKYCENDDNSNTEYKFDVVYSLESKFSSGSVK